MTKIVFLHCHGLLRLADFLEGSASDQYSPSHEDSRYISAVSYLSSYKRSLQSLPT